MVLGSSLTTPELLIEISQSLAPRMQPPSPSTSQIQAEVPLDLQWMESILLNTLGPMLRRLWPLQMTYNGFTMEW